MEDRQGGSPGAGQGEALGSHIDSDRSVCYIYARRTVGRFMSDTVITYYGSFLLHLKKILVRFKPRHSLLNVKSR